MRSPVLAAAAMGALVSLSAHRSDVMEIVIGGEGDDVIRGPTPKPAIAARAPRLPTSADLARVEAAQRRRAEKVARQAKGFTQ
jgi:hypothetical protein